MRPNHVVRGSSVPRVKRDERQGCRSLLCDPKGIIVAETVFRCMICRHVDASIGESRQHYYQQHMSSKREIKAKEEEAEDKEVEGDGSGNPVYSNESSLNQSFNESKYSTGARPCSGFGSNGNHREEEDDDQHYDLRVDHEIDSDEGGSLVIDPFDESHEGSDEADEPEDGVNHELAGAEAVTPGIGSTTAIVGKPGFVTCAVCGVTRYYSCVYRRYGHFTCQVCYRFFRTFFSKPKRYACPNLGSCPLNVRTRCRACWLQSCINLYTVDGRRRAILNENLPIKSGPEADADAHEEDPYSMQAYASFGESGKRFRANDWGHGTDGSPMTLSLNQGSSSGHHLGALPPNTIIQPSYNGYTESRSSRDPVAMTSTPSSASFQNSTSYPAKKLMTRASARKSTGTSLSKAWSCMTCANCLAEDCGRCIYCLDKTKNGGRYTLRQRCIRRRCLTKIESNNVNGNGHLQSC